jgi:hypothetical protein
VDKVTLKNYGIIEGLVEKYFPLDEESMEKFSKSLYNPEIDERYKELIDSENLRLKVPLTQEDAESFDIGWKDFKDIFRSFINEYDITYGDFSRGTAVHEKQSVKISKLMAKFYFDNKELFTRTIYGCYENEVTMKLVSKHINRTYAELSGNKFSMKDKNYSLVLSLNFADWFLCSSGESWTSCLNLDSGYSGAYWSGLPGTIIDKNRALLYFTTGEKKEYQGITVDKITKRSWVLLDRDDIFHIIRFFPQKIQHELIQRKFPGTWKYVPNESYKWRSKHELDFLKHKTGDSCFIYQDNTQIEKENGKFSFISSPGNGGFWHTNKRNDVVYDELFSYDGGLYSLIRHERNLNDFIRFNGHRCHHCSSNIYNDDNDINWYHGGPFCGDCFSRLFVPCPRCDEPARDEDFHNVMNEHGVVEKMCETCFERLYAKCSTCGNYHLKESDMMTLTFNGYICNPCFHRKYYKCETCGENVLRGGRSDIGDGEKVCYNCRTSKKK